MPHLCSVVCSNSNILIESYVLPFLSVSSVFITFDFLHENDFFRYMWYYDMNQSNIKNNNNDHM